MDKHIRYNSRLPGWLDTQEARDLLGCSVTKLWYLRKSGQLEYSLCGRNIFYRIESIYSMLERNKVAKELVDKE